MVIKYRPHRRFLDESMAEAQTFSSIDKMFDYIVSQNPGLFSKEDLSVGSNWGKDQRIDWSETRYVCTRRFGDEEFCFPQCIGFCSMEANDGTKN